MPGWKTIGSVLALGIPGTALAYLLFFGLITGAGAAYASLVTYLIPPIALAYGAIFLGERFGAAAFGGLALILAGVALGTGAVGFARARQPQPVDALVRFASSVSTPAHGRHTRDPVRLLVQAAPGLLGPEQSAYWWTSAMYRCVACSKWRRLYVRRWRSRVVEIW